MPPWPARSSAMVRLRSATRRAPSSRERMPAAQAAAISPCEWPATTSGVTPAACHTLARETMTAHSAGCTTSTRLRACSSPRTSRSRQSVCGASASAQAPMASAKTGEDVISPVAMPTHWAPWPGKTNATLAPARAVPCTRPGASAVPSARAVSAPARSSPKTTARCVKAARVRTSAAATASASGAAVSPAAPTKVRSRAAWSYSAASFLADSGQGGTTPVRTGAAPPASAAGASVSGSSASGACSRMTWALVPLMPNEDTAARRGRPVSGQATGSVTSSTAPAVQSTCGVGSSTCRVGGTTPCWRASTILMTPAMPAADWVCPMLDFTEPSSSGRSSGRSWPYVASSACASIGSPSVVPVPCASRASTSAGESPALARA